MEISWDMSGLEQLERDLNSVQRRDRAERQKAIAEVARFSAEFVYLRMKRNTGRSRRALAIAARQAGVAQLPEVSLRKSYLLKKTEELFIQMVEVYRAEADNAHKRAQRIDRILEAWYHRRGRKRDKWYRTWSQQATRERRQAERFIRWSAQAREQLEIIRIYPHAIVMGGLGPQGWRGDVEFVIPSNRRQVASVRYKIYGGEGRAVETEGNSVVILKLLEPHSTIIEKRDGNFRASRAQLKGRVLIAGEKYLRNTLGVSVRGKAG